MSAAATDVDPARALEGYGCVRSARPTPTKPDLRCRS